MKIKTKRLLIRPFRKEDIDDIFEIYSNPDVCTYLLYNEWKQEEKEIKFNKKLNSTKLDTHSTLSLACEYQHKVIGNISVWYTDMKETVEIGYAFNPKFHHQGFASEAMKEIVNYLFAHYSIHRIQANLDARNIESKKVCESIGMRLEAHFIQDYWNKVEWTDSYVYGMLKEDL